MRLEGKGGIGGGGGGGEVPASWYVFMCFFFFVPAYGQSAHALENVRVDTNKILFIGILDAPQVCSSHGVPREIDTFERGCYRCLNSVSCVRLYVFLLVDVLRGSIYRCTRSRRRRTPPKQYGGLRKPRRFVVFFFPSKYYCVRTASCDGTGRQGRFR